jgi:hypothetical protein
VNKDKLYTIDMKKLILSAILATFAVAVYAGESCEGSSCCSSMKTTQTKSTTCSASEKTVAKSSKAKTGTKQALKSPKAMSLASR